MSSEHRDLQNKVAIITGASSGVGEAIAFELARHHARVVIAARRTDRLAALKLRILETVPGKSINHESI